MDRFIRTQLLLGEEAFEVLQHGAVTVVGVGAVGGYAVEALARSGIKRIRIVDFDTVAPSNINRQLLALETTINRRKIDLATKRIQAINSECVVEALPLFCRDDTIETILSPAPDLLIDAIDSLNPKCGLLQHAWQKGIPTISSMGAAMRTDPACVKTGDLFSSTGCPLARHVRRRLRHRGIEKGITCVYSTEKVAFDFSEKSREEFEDQGRARHILGSLPTIPGIFGLTIANRAILHLSGIKPL